MGFNRSFRAFPFRARRLAAGIAFGFVAANPAAASDGVVEINQVRAAAGGITAGDTAGFPVTISERGSYRLTGNLVSADPNTRMIDVTSDNVTIDLSGFSVIGPVTCTGAASSVSCSNTGSAEAIAAVNVRHVSVLNGTIRGAGADGLRLGYSCRIDGVTTENNGRNGFLAATYCTIRNSSARGNGERGLFAGAGTTVDHCVSSENKTHGFELGSYSAIHASVASVNGSDGINTAVASSVVGNTVGQNEGAGIRSGSGSAITDNAAYSNATDGITAGASSTVSRNSAYTNHEDQIQTAASSVIGNAVRSLTGQGWGLNLTGVVSSGYGQNTISTSGALGTVTGGTSMGSNVCNGVGC